MNIVQPVDHLSIIWILVADGGRAQIYQYHKDRASMPTHDLLTHLQSTFAESRIG